MSEQSRIKFKIIEGTEIELIVTNGVFLPTGTTSTLLKAVTGYIQKPGTMLDLGCGSGVVGISLNTLGFVKAPLYASDLEEETINCVKKNAHNNQCAIVAEYGSLFEPWQDKKFDYIVDDVAGVSEGAAKISPWYKDVPCACGVDGTSLIVKVLKEAPEHLNPDGKLFFPVISLSNVDKILSAAFENFNNVEKLSRQEWPLPKEMLQHLPILKKMREEGHIQFSEKFGMIFYFTDVYVAFS